MLSERDYMSARQDNSPYSCFRLLLLIIPAIYVLQVMEGFFFKSNGIEYFGALSGNNIRDLYLWTLFSYGFLHNDFYHILFNLLGFYFLGKGIIAWLNQSKFLILYLGGILIGGVFWLTFNLSASPATPLLGASAGVSAMLIFFCCIFAQRPVSFLFIPIFIPARFIGWGFFIITLFFFFHGLDSSLQEQGNRIAHAAHLGGIVWGYFFYKVIYPAPLLAWLGRNRRPRAKRPARTAANTYHYKVNIDSRDDLKQEVDRILDKINTLGFGALTDAEKRTLDQARDILKH